MGLYPAVCKSCKKPFLWFSGWVFQVCPDCVTDEERERGINKMFGMNPPEKREVVEPGKSDGT